MKFILGKKIRMSQIFDEQGKLVPITAIEAGPCKVLQIKTQDRDGYEAIQVGFGKLKEKKVKKPQKDKPFRYVREFREKNPSATQKDSAVKYEVGKEFNVSIFKEGDVVVVSGISKGKGFAGGMKRWGFSGLPMTRGTKHKHRAIGSIGTGLSRVIKGKKMPGRMGTDRVSIKNVKVVKVDPENNLLIIKGSVPGARGTLLEIKA